MSSKISQITRIISLICEIRVILDFKNVSLNYLNFGHIFDGGNDESQFYRNTTHAKAA
jgi:hypothetical protein